MAKASGLPYRIGVLGGDGIGPEVLDQGLRVLEAVASQEGISYETVDYPHSGTHYLETGELVTPDVIEEWRGLDAVLLGAIGHPEVEVGLVERSVILGLRFGLDLFVNLRPITDYDIDYIQGRILLAEPLAATVADGQLVRDEGLGGDEAWLVVQYEHTPGFDDVDAMATGGRAHYWLNDHVKLGLTANDNSQERSLDSSLYAADLTVRRSADSWFKLQAGRSEGLLSSSLRSDDGGFSFLGVGSSSPAAAGASANAYRADLNLSLGDFFDASVRGTGELPLETLLHTHGIAYTLRASSGSGDKGGKKLDNSKQRSVWLGATLTETNGKSTFASVVNGGPAELAGIAPGDKAVALDGLQLTSANADSRLKAYRDGDELDLVVFRGDELLTARVRLEAAPLDTCYLELIEDVELDVESRRMAWLHA